MQRAAVGLAGALLVVAAVVRYPTYRYGYALGSPPVAGFEAQEPALAVVPRLRQLLGPGDRLS